MNNRSISDQDVASGTRGESIETIIDLVNVTKTYDGTLDVLKRINFRVNAGESVAVAGVSGSGKSTLLNILATLDAPTGGAYYFSGGCVCDHETTPKGSLSSAARSELRSRMGFIFQTPFMLTNFSVRYNVSLPIVIQQVDDTSIKSRADDCMNQLGILEKAGMLAHQISGGQRQRVAIGRALVHNPCVILADEPTGSLDTAHAAEVMEILMKMVQERGAALVLVTHNPDHAVMCDRLFHLCRGRLTEFAAKDKTGEKLRSSLRGDFLYQKQLDGLG